MTFGIGFVSPLYAGIVTDRLLSGDYVADSDKCGAVAYRNGRFVYTIAGLAEAGPQYLARKELATALCEAGHPPEADGRPVMIDEALDRVAAYMARKLASVRVSLAEQKKTSILLAGYRRDEDGTAHGQLHLISNFESLDGESGDDLSAFHVSTHNIQGAGLAWIGSANVLSSTRETVFGLLERGDNIRAGTAVSALVNEVRRGARVDPKTIGTRCTSLSVSRETGRFEVGYHPGEAATGYVPATAFVHALYGNDGAYVTLDQRLTGAKNGKLPVDVYVEPPEHKRQRCPCGSGRRYKNCHGNARVVHQIDSYNLSGRTKVLAMPEDGSELQIFSNDMLKR